MNIEWIMHPFPHAIVDNFFSEEVFEKISSAGLLDLANLQRTNTTELELNKSEFGMDGTSESFRIPIEVMGKGNGKKLFSKFIPESKITTLASFDNFRGYYPYHRSTRNGLLGSHVDHSSLDSNFHFANTIFYSHKEWKKDWGGETVLFSSSGMSPIVSIEPKPNRMVFFIHSNSSFHGVNKILCPENISRNTYYMDYYIDPSDVSLLNSNMKIHGLKKDLKFTYHLTTFIPFFPLGFKSFTFGSLFSSFQYLKNYIIYRIFKFRFMSNLRFKYINEIRSIKKLFKNS